MARLGDICIQITDGSHNPPMGVEQSNYLMLSSKNIDDDHITFNDPRYLSQEDFEAENKRTNIKPNDLLITIVGTIGRVAIVPNSLTEFCVQRSVAVLKPKPEMVYNRFLMYYLQNMRPYLEQESRGVAQKGIYLKQLSNLSIILPPLDEQRKIAAVLDKVSDLIAKRRQQLDKLDELIKARFVEMFGDPVTNPNQWEKVPLSDLADVRIGPFGSLLHKEDYIAGGHPLVNPSHILDDKIVVDKKLSVSEQKYAELEPYHLKIGDVVMGRRGEMGRCAVVQYEGLLCGTGSLLIRTKGNVTADYIQKIISFPSFKKTIEDMAVGQTMPNLNVPIVSNFQIIKPPLQVQKKYYQFVEQTEKIKTAISRSLEKLETLKKALMQKYFG